MMPTGAGAGSGGASSGEIRAGQAFVELFTKDSALIKGLNRGRARVLEWGQAIRKIGLGVMAAGVGLLAPVVALANGAIQKAINGDFGLEAAKKASRAAVAWEEMITALQGALLPVLTELVPHLVMFTDIVKANKELVPIIGAVGLGLIAAGAAAFVLGQAMTMASTAIGSVLTAGGILMGLLKFLISPVGLVILTVGGLTAAFLALYEIFGQGSVIKSVAMSIYESFSWAFKGIGDDFRVMFRGIIDAMRGGDLVLAGNIALKGLEIVWKRITMAITDIWRNFTRGISDIWYDAIASILKIGISFRQEVEDLFDVGPKSNAEKLARINEKQRELQEVDNLYSEIKRATVLDDALKKKLAELELKKLRDELVAMGAQAAAAVPPSSPGMLIPNIAAIQGGFAAPNWGQVLAVSSKIPEQQLGVMKKQLAEQEKMREALENAQPMKVVK